MTHFENIPMSLFKIAASFEDSDFKVTELMLLDSQEFQLNIGLKCEPDVMIVIRFLPDKIQYLVGESYSGHYSEFYPWVNSAESIERFKQLYLEYFGRNYWEPELETV